MGQACCNYSDKDANNENFGKGNKTIKTGATKMYILSETEG